MAQVFAKNNPSLVRCADNPPMTVGPFGELALGLAKASAPSWLCMTRQQHHAEKPHLSPVLPVGASFGRGAGDSTQNKRGLGKCGSCLTRKFSR